MKEENRHLCSTQDRTTSRAGTTPSRKASPRYTEVERPEEEDAAEGRGQAEKAVGSYSRAAKEAKRGKKKALGGRKIKVKAV